MVGDKPFVNGITMDELNKAISDFTSPNATSPNATSPNATSHGMLPHLMLPHLPIMVKALF